MTVVMTTERPSMKERQRRLREDTILDAARELLVSKGFAAMTLDDVIVEVGVSKTTLYQHFASKEELVLSVLRREIGRAHAQLRALEASLSPAEAIRAMIGWSVEQRFSPGQPCRFDVTGVLSAQANESLRADEVGLLRTLEDLFTRAQREGGVKPGIIPLLAAQSFLSIVKDWSFDGLLRAGQLDLSSMKTGIAALFLNEKG